MAYQRRPAATVEDQFDSLTSNFARHCIYNMIRITQVYEKSPSKLLSDTLLRKQKFLLYVFSDATKDRMQLIGTEMVFNIEALLLRLRNFNIEVNFALKSDIYGDDLKKALDYFFLRNLQLAIALHEIAGKLDELINSSKKTRYSKRMYYICCNKGTIFNENDFKDGSKKTFAGLSTHPDIGEVNNMLRIYLDVDNKRIETKEYSALSQMYVRIDSQYKGDEREWFGAKWRKRSKLFKGRTKLYGSSGISTRPHLIQ